MVLPEYTTTVCRRLLLSLKGDCVTKFTVRHVSKGMLLRISDGGPLPPVSTGKEILTKAGIIISCLSNQ
jgi:hypothetical protein